MQRMARAAAVEARRPHPQALAQMRTAGMTLQSRCGISSACQGMLC